MSVKILTDENYAEELATKNAVIKFYASWCGSCRLFAPKFKRLSESVDGVDFFEVDAENNPNIRKISNVTSLPYFGVFKNGEFIEGLSTSKEEALLELIEKNK